MAVRITKATVNNIDEWRIYVNGKIAARCPTEHWANIISIFLEGVSGSDDKYYEPNPNFKFAFETEDDLWKAKMGGYIPLCDIVRINIRNLTTNNTLDYPVTSREQYINALKAYKERDDVEILNVYQDKWCYNINDYD